MHAALPRLLWVAHHDINCRMASGRVQVRGDREQLLQQAREKGTVEVKDAIRRTLKGAKIQLTSGVLWTIEAPTGKQVLGRVTSPDSQLGRTCCWCAGELLGQAVQINEWELEDGSRGGPLASGAGPSAEAAPAASSAATADPEAVTAAGELDACCQRC